MTFEQFIATRKWSDNLAADCPPFSDRGDDSDDGQHPQPGYIYDGCLWIGRVEPWWPINNDKAGQW